MMIACPSILICFCFLQEKHEETSKILSESNGRVVGGGCNNTTSSGSNVGIVGGDDGVGGGGGGVCMGAGGDLNLSNYTMATATTNNFSNNSGGVGSHNTTADHNAENNIEVNSNF